MNKSRSAWMCTPLAALSMFLGSAFGQSAPAAEPAPTRAPATTASTTPRALRLSIDPGVIDGPFSGRVYILLSDSQGDPRRRMNDWFRPPMIYSKDVQDLAPGEEIAVDDSWIGFPTPFSQVKPGEYAVQAVVRRNLDSPNPGEGPGDLYSDPEKMEIPASGDDEDDALLRVTQVVKERPFRETEQVKLVEIVSPSLSAFHNREYKVRAGVSLPAGFDPSRQRKYPVVVSVTGFGGDHRGALGIARMVPDDAKGEVIMVVPDPLCYRGHSVFADSANNGPWGEMLIKELLPEIEKRYNGVGPQQRYVTGGSSGGWSSLWLQVTYPEAFAGCWSHCPDPVDFRDFQQCDLYAQGSNLYTMTDGTRRPIARMQGNVALWYEDFCKREWALGPGGQIHSFEAVFSPRGSDGTPELIFDRKTGAIDANVAKSWEKYDIRLVLERNWEELAPKLKGKLHIYAGAEDNFYLEGATELLKKSLADLGSDAVVEIIEGMGHSVYREGNLDMFRTVMERAGVKKAEAVGEKQEAVKSQ
ncbi:MAG TPA: alpha/beta hydrolase-fold protein [Phycisphaerales bacterium]|nr:alpha/beta hydrolase-fold protein [Phycisphaerales bacterium]